jgi:hypothetical protein
LKSSGVRRAALLACLAVLVASAAQPLFAQEPPPPIGPLVFDVHGVLPMFDDSAELAQSRGLGAGELPGIGLGVSGGAHYYLPKVAGITIGIGAEAMLGRSHADGSEPPSTTGGTTGATTGTTSDTTTPVLRPVTETLKTFSPQLSLNFGSGNGWSYLSFGIGRSIWSIVPDGAAPQPVDEQSIRTITYGGGARWFIKPRMAFSLDFRFYEIDAVADVGSPRTVFLVIGAGLSFK